MKILLIMNPGSRDGRSKKRFEKIFNLLHDRSVVYDHHFTTSLEDAKLASKKGNLAGYDQIVAVGGDGTINQVLNGFYDQKGKRLSSAKMAVLYTGTSPDFCKSYNIPLDLTAAVDLIARSESHEISVGKVEMHGLSKYFACCANIGIGASLARAANSGIRKKMGDFLGTFTALLSLIFKFKLQDVSVTVNDKEFPISSLLNLSIGRTHYIASGIKVHNDLNECDQRFYLLTVSNIRWWQWIGVFFTIYRGKKFKNRDEIRLGYGNRIEISNPGLEVEFDGDPAGETPALITIATDRLDLIRWKEKRA